MLIQQHNIAARFREESALTAVTNAGRSAQRGSSRPGV
jgi:hypothetical protein